MNGIHDMGGMDGFGPIEREEDEPVFHEPWEGRVLALTRACGAWGKWNIDKSRFGIEQMPPEDYLRASYYEKWLRRLEKLLVEAGMITREELDQRHAALKQSEGAP
jgi:nitrile hydratase subunit beta